MDVLERFDACRVINSTGGAEVRHLEGGCIICTWIMLVRQCQKVERCGGRWWSRATRVGSHDVTFRAPALAIEYYVGVWTLERMNQELK